MAVPKKKTTRGKTNKRRIHLFLRPIKLITCLHCNRPKQPHAVCLSCGFYKGKEVIDVIEKLKPEDKKVKEREKK